MSTSTEVASSTTVRVELAGDRVRVHLACDAPVGAPQVRPLLLGSDARSARVALVPDGALLLAEDHVRISVEVGPGAALELVEPGGTVAYDMGGGWARWDVSVAVGADASLIWHGEPFVVSGGAGVRRTTRAVVHERAQVAVREVLVLGRHGEASGRLVQTVVCDDPAGRPLLVEGLDVDARRAAALLGGNAVMVSAVVLGAHSCDAGPATVRYDLEAGGHLYRACAGSVHEAIDHALWDQVVRAIRSRTSNSMPTASAR
ncbi:urease accessory protein UreD [Nocardioides jiangxiensis]|uniref:Urease accessory protein UreD n=1 Tax=Nocardioides jiangxiensis TaxID=3064524 RepID=A0ABT9AWL0_9ACTN|nr:urease accessory protein UreD [Nocardioides sp. WY-20]MDO7866831.1 urease accessory protein UreD [Nocardioides sp. WY-20]